MPTRANNAALFRVMPGVYTLRFRAAWSVSVGFGLDKFIVVNSGAALLWRLHHDLDHSRHERVERTTPSNRAGCCIALAACVAYESGCTLIGHEIPERSNPGVIV